MAVSITLFSCSKDSPGNDPSKKDALTTGSWKLTGLMRDYQKDGHYEENTYAMLDGCLKDNIYTFQADGTLITDAGPLKCYDTDPQTRTSSWSFTDNQNGLQFAGSNYQIEELTESILILKGTLSHNVIYTINQKVTYSKQ